MTISQAKTGVEVERLPELPPTDKNYWQPVANGTGWMPGFSSNTGPADGWEVTKYYTADQMRAYATASLAAERAEAVRMRVVAKEALDFMENMDPDSSFNPPTAEWAKSLTANLSNALKGGLPDVANVDAGRYRWLRGWGVAVERGGHIYTGDALDILVDGNMRLDAALSPSQGNPS